MKSLPPPQRASGSGRSTIGGAFISIIVVLGVIGALNQLFPLFPSLNRADKEIVYQCHPPLPNLFTDNPPNLDNEAIARAGARLDDYLTERASHDDIDSLVVAIGTSAGPLWFKGYGAVRANESRSGPPPDLDTIYRLASVTKMFVTLDTLILRDKGHLNWDDPVDKYIPSFAYRPHGWSSHRKAPSAPINRPPITFRQLASHLSGLGRDYPPITISNPMSPISEWNETQETPTVESVLHAIRSHPLIAPQWTYPVYSNTGFNVLGWANLAASQIAASAQGVRSVETFSELIKKDIFEPVGMNSSFYSIPPGLENRVAVNHLDPEESDGLPEAYHPAGGQASSARDLLQLMTHFLAPSDKTILSPTTIDEWFRPIHVWNDGLTQGGAPWEILRLPSSGGGSFDLYSKSGNLLGFHTQFALDRANGYGIVILMTGEYTDAGGIAARVAEEYFHPAFKSALVQATTERYAGTYNGSQGHEVHISVKDDVLSVDKLVVNRVDVLKKMFMQFGSQVEPVALWPTGTADGEFRMAFGRPDVNHAPRAGCEPYWVSIDLPLANEAPLDLLYFEDNGDLIIPAMNLSLPRQ